MIALIPRRRSTVIARIAQMILAGVFLVVASFAVAQDAVLFAPGDRLEIVRRFNYSTRVDGRYAGHVQREDRVSLRETGSGPRGEREFIGETWSSTTTVRNLATVASQVDRRTGLQIDWIRGRLVQEAGDPTWQGIPTIPPTPERVPDERQWEAPALVRVVLPGGEPAMIPTTVVYRIDGLETYRGEELVRVTFGYRLVWPQPSSSVQYHSYGRVLSPREMPSNGMTIRANRQGHMLLPPGAGVPAFQRTEINDQYQTRTGREERSGFLLTWYTGSRPPGGLIASTGVPAGPGSPREPVSDGGRTDLRESIRTPDAPSEGIPRDRITPDDRGPLRDDGRPGLGDSPGAPGAPDAPREGIPRDRITPDDRPRLRDDGRPGLGDSPGLPGAPDAPREGIPRDRMTPDDRDPFRDDGGPSLEDERPGEVVVEAPPIVDVEVDRDELDRVRLSIKNLQFVADQATLLPGERGRLDQIAEYLQLVPEMTVLVTGHTAAIGTVESQQSLSVERAETIVDAMIARGVAPGRFRFEGRGGSEPIGDNATPEGRALNRRVEIRLIE